MAKYGYHNGEKYWNVRDSEGQFAKGAGAALKKIADLKLPTIKGNFTALEKKKLRSERRKIGQKMLDNGHPAEKVKAALSLEPAAWPKLKDVKPYNGTSAEKNSTPKAPAPKVDLSENGHLDAAGMSKSIPPAEVKKMVEPLRQESSSNKAKIDAMSADQKLVLARSIQLKNESGNRPEVELYAQALRDSVLPSSGKASNSVQAEFAQDLSSEELQKILMDHKNWSPSLTTGEKNMIDVMLTEKLESAPKAPASKKAPSKTNLADVVGEMRDHLLNNPTEDRMAYLDKMVKKHPELEDLAIDWEEEDELELMDVLSALSDFEKKLKKPTPGVEKPAKKEAPAAPKAPEPSTGGDAQRTEELTNALKEIEDKIFGDPTKKRKKIIRDMEKKFPELEDLSLDWEEDGDFELMEVMSALNTFRADLKNGKIKLQGSKPKAPAGMTPAPELKTKSVEELKAKAPKTEDSSTPKTVAELKLPSIEGNFTALEKKNLRSQRRKIAQLMLDYNYPASIIKSDLGPNPINWPTLADIKKAGPIKKR